MSDDAVTAWLREFGRHLPERGARRRRTVTELEEHLMDAMEDASRRGAADPAAEAVARVGAPSAVAAGFRRPARIAWALALLLWLPAAAAASVSVGTAYLIGQQVVRQSANDPQVQLAQDAARQLSTGAAPSTLTAGPTIDLAESLAVSVTVLDRAGRVVGSTARLDGGTPRPPLGALASATPGNPDVLTWQPRPGVRQAAVIAAYQDAAGGGTVVVARSLRLVEQREDQLLWLAVAGWLAALAAAGLVAIGVAGRWGGGRQPGQTLAAAVRA